MDKSDRAYLKMLESKRDGLNRQINQLQADKEKIVIEIIKVQSGVYEWKQEELNMDELQQTFSKG